MWKVTCQKCKKKKKNVLAFSFYISLAFNESILFYLKTSFRSLDI